MDFKKTLNPREMILGTLLLLALLFLFLKLFYSPKRASLSLLTTQANNLKMEREALQKITHAISQNLPEKKSALRTSPPLQILKGELAPLAIDTSPLLAHLTNPNLLGGITIKEMKDQQPEPDNGYKKAPFEIRAQAPFRNILYYLEKLEQFPALMLIENISLKGLDTKATQMELSLKGALFKLEGTHALQ